MAERRGRSFWILALWAIGGVGALLLVLFAVLLGPWLFTKNTEGLNPDQRLKAENDVRTTLVQALAGVAVAGGLVMTYRTYQLNRAEQDRTYERELYAKAVEQLGAEQAPVRLGALYSLERLAQDRPDRRQTVVDMFCAYLRMPYVPPTIPSGAEQPIAGQPEHDSAQELQVRQTVQRLLAIHLKSPEGTGGEDAQRLPRSRDEAFWPGISLDLTGATLVELNLTAASVMHADFTNAVVAGGRFDEANFIGHTSFHKADFSEGTFFRKTTFTGTVDFVFARFTLVAKFREAVFTEGAYFELTNFMGNADFSGATFAGPADFIEATFTRSAWFQEATFAGSAWFRQATFGSAVDFRDVKGDATYHHAVVLDLGDSMLADYRTWPVGWTVRPDPEDPSRGTLAQKDPEPTKALPAEE